MNARAFDSGAFACSDAPSEQTQRQRLALVERELTAVRAELADARQAAESGRRAKADLLASMSHEFRTPLNGMIGMLELLRDTPLTEEQRDFAESAQHSAEALLSLFTDMLEFTRMEVGQFTVERRLFDFVEALSEVLEAHQLEAAQRGLQLTLEVAPETPRLVLGDRERVARVLRHLLVNASARATDGELRVQVREVSRSVGESSLRVAVHDPGPALDEAQLQVLNQRSAAGEAEAESWPSGIGVGLAVVRRLVPWMGGAAGADSTAEGGTTNWFTVQVGRAEGSILACDPSAAFAACRALRISGDGADSADEVLGLLRSWRISVESCATGWEVLAELRSAHEEQRPYNLLLVDRPAGRMDGATLARIVRTDAALADLPILAIEPAEPVSDGAGSWWSERVSRPIDEGLLAAAVRRLTAEPPPVSADPEPLAPAPAVPSAPVTVLLAEDNPINQHVAMRMLEKLGCTVEVADNGVQALERMFAAPYDIVFMDCMMPEMDGYEATAAIRRLPDGRARTPIVAVTANALPGDREKCLDAGMDDYLPKPVKPEQLAESLRRWVPSGVAAATAEAAPHSEPCPAAAFDDVLDLSMIEVLRDLQDDDDPEFVAELIGVFIAELPDHLAALHQALETAAPDDVRAGAHKIRGAAANLGAAPLSELCAELEQRGRDGELAGADEMLNRIDTLAERSCEALRQVMATDSG